MDPFERYAAQTRLPFLGRPEQERLAAATAVVLGVGATGSVVADALVRAGVGTVRLVDRDVVELGNLHRQVLYDERDVREGLPKAEAARRRLAAVNGSVRVEARVADFVPGNALALLEGADVVLDGTDTFAARFLLNDACAALGVPWVYAGVVGTAVHGFPVVWGQTACFRCYLPEPPPPGSTATCERSGVLGPAVLVAGGFAASEGLKLLLGQGERAAEGLWVVDVWTREARRVGLPRDPACPTCRGRHDFLAGEALPARLCGQRAVALPAPAGARLDLERLADDLAARGRVELRNSFLLRFVPADAPEQQLTVFVDGRAIVKGTDEVSLARSLYAKFVGG
ncbi:MAG: thiazole biosynthesis adenylyltransferase ThiF [Planctomycetota bacterium]|nr:MAG: thiazole biosynthesis adenylyltransferase ThiF [Planctomycetota bacterium]